MISDTIVARLLENGLPLQISIPSRSGLSVDELQSYLVEAVNFVQAQTTFLDMHGDVVGRTGVAEITSSKVLHSRDVWFTYVDEIRARVEAFLKGLSTTRGTVLLCAVRPIDEMDWSFKIKIWNKVR